MSAEALANEGYFDNTMAVDESNKRGREEDSASDSDVETESNSKKKDNRESPSKRHYNQIESKISKLSERVEMVETIRLKLVGSEFYRRLNEENYPKLKPSLLPTNKWIKKVTDLFKANELQDPNNNILIQHKI